MRFTLVKTALFLLLLFIVVNVFAYILYQNGYSPKYTLGPEVYRTIAKSKKVTAKKHIILGDSIAAQIFSQKAEENTQYLHMASNQAVSLVGQYIIMANLIESNRETIEEFVLIYRYATFDNNLDQVYTFDYFISPFLMPENHIHFSENVWEAIEKCPLYFLGYLPFQKFLPTMPLVDYASCNGLDPNDMLVKEFSSLSIEYLQKMMNLAKRNNIRFTLVPGVLSEELYLDVQRVRRIYKKTINQGPFKELFMDYFDSIIYLPAEDFMDSVHLKKDVLKKYRRILIERQLKQARSS